MSEHDIKGDCRSCGSADLHLVLDLGQIAVADRLLRENQLGSPEPTFQLRVGFCPACALLQLTDVFESDTLYDEDYPYYTTEVPGLLAHFQESARAILERMPLGSSSLVIEAASNDGYMLMEFANRGIPVLGIDPAPGPARKAEAAGVPTVVDFFCTRVAEALRVEGRRADLLLGNNVLNLVPDPIDFARAVDLLLAPSGTVILEVPYSVDMVRHGWYDNVFHQNNSYFTLIAIDRLFRQYGLYLNNVERVHTFGGSIRVMLSRQDRASNAVEQLLGEERALGVDQAEWYERFGTLAESNITALRALIFGLHAERKRIAAYGAAGGMATTMLGFLDVEGCIDYAIDGNPHKHGWWTPGSHLLIVPPDRLREDPPDYVLLLAWNYADEILAAQQEYRNQGGKFILPFPEPHIV